MTDTVLTVPLYRLAHGRTGDKGNRSNISVIAWHPALWDVLVDQVTEEAVARQFALRRPSPAANPLAAAVTEARFASAGARSTAVRTLLARWNSGAIAGWAAIMTWPTSARSARNWASPGARDTSAARAKTSAA